MKRVFSLLFLILFFFSISIESTFAKGSLLKGFSSNCLDARMAGADAARMIIIPSKRPKENKKTYIFMCSGKKNICGASSTDGTNINALLFGITSQKANEELGKAGIQTQGGVTSGKNPTTTTSDGLGFIDDPIIIAQHTEYGIFHRFFWVQSLSDDGEIQTPVETLAPDQGLVFDENDMTMKLGQIIFDTPAPSLPTTTGKGEGKQCANIKWDPRGFVFDAATLNPVRNTTITLYEKKDDNTYVQVTSGIGLMNPYTTSTDSGQFNFFVNPGLYKMTVNSPNIAIADKSSINPAYQQLFADEKSQTNIYEKNTDIEEVAGRVAVAHIPVQVTNKNLIIDTLQLIIKDAVVNIDEVTHKTRMHITGTVSHPKSKLTIMLTMVDSAGEIVVAPPIVSFTNDLGEYETYIDQEQFGSDGKQLFLQNINIKLELNSFYNSKTNSISYDIKPVPLYIEGVAYDTQGAPIPGAIIGIYPFYSPENPMHMVIADKNGRFRIGSQNIPEVDYTLRYKKPNGEIIITDPATFVRQNSALYLTEGINPFETKQISAAEQVNMKTLIDRTVTENDLRTLADMSGNFKDVSENRMNNFSEVVQKSTSPGLVVIFIGLGLLILIGISITVVVLIKRK